MADNVWGTGGLFEKALASKIDRQNSASALDRSNVGVGMLNAQANMLDTNNRFDLGMQTNATNRLKIGNDYDLGLRGARTDMFNAETNRADKASMWANPMTSLSSNNLGLRTFNPVQSQKPGFMNGGKVKTMKAMAGYNKGGKVKMVAACADGGKIGDVEHDTGKDTIDAKVRPGEYMLNPETVAHVGGGNYEHGVRQLNALVREATGKEPGPTPLPKGEQGFAESGEAGWFGRARDAVGNGFRRAGDFVGGGGADEFKLNDPAGPKAAPSAAAGPSAEARAWQAERAAQEARFASAGRPAAGAAGRFNQILDMPAGQAAKATGQAIKSGAGKAVSAAGKVLKPLSSGAGRLALPLTMAGTAAEVAGTDTQDYANRLALSPGDVDGFWKDVGVRSLGALQDFGNNVSFGLADRAGNLISGNGFQRSDYYKPKQAPVAAANAPAAAVAAAPAETPAAAAAPAAPSLRDQLRARIAENDANKEFIGGSRRAEQTTALLKELSDLEKADIQAGAAGRSSMAGAALKAREDADKRIADRFQIPKFDKEGRVVGYEQDPNAGNKLRDFVAQLRTQDGKPIDYYALSPEQQDKLLNQFDTTQRGLRAFESRVKDQSGDSAIVSTIPRVGKNALQFERNSDGTAKHVSVGDIWDDNINTWDWLKSFGGGLNNRIAVDPATGQRVVASRVAKGPNGVDLDVLQNMGLRRDDLK